MAKRKSTHSTTPENEKAILDAVMRLAVNAGYEGTTMSEVAKASGLPIGSVYWHFENKDKLFAELLEYCFGLWREYHAGQSQKELLRAAITGSAAGSASPDNTKEAFWVLGLIFALEKRLGDNIARQKYLEIRSRMFETVVTQLAGQFPDDAIKADPEFVRKIAAFSRALTDGFYVSASAGDDIDFVELAELSTLAVDLLTEHYTKLGAATGTEGDAGTSVEADSDAETGNKGGASRARKSKIAAESKPNSRTVTRSRPRAATRTAESPVAASRSKGTKEN